MYKLYNVKHWGSMAPHFVLEELGVPYQNIWMTPEQVRTEEFRRLSPLGFIPALGLDDGRTIIESMAIIAFLTEAHSDRKLAPRPGTDDSAAYLSSLAFISSNIYAMINFAEFSADYSADLAVQKEIKNVPNATITMLLTSSMAALARKVRLSWARSFPPPISISSP